MRTSRWKFVHAALLGALSLAGCGDDGSGPSAGGGRIEIESIAPVQGSRSAGVADTIVVRYSGDVVMPASPSFVLLRGSDTVPATFVQRDTRTLLLAPTEILELGQSYTVQVRGVTGTNAVAAPDTTWTFTTAGRALGSVDGTRMFADLQALAHDSMRGRGSGTADELKAAGYLVQRFHQVGLSDPGLQSFTAAGVNSQNVHGVLRGTGALANEWVVIGGHYDHIGVTAAGINNGADDNASGTAGVIELARVLAAHAQSGGFGNQSRRSVLFIGFGVEERGLWGSAYFCAHPLMPLAAVGGMINLDMIGRLRNNAVEAWVNVGYPGAWIGLLERYRGDLSVPIRASGLVGTDYRCFVQYGRPGIALFTGTHPEYHQPTDDAVLIDVGGMVKVVNVAASLAADLMLRPRPPVIGQ